MATVATPSSMDTKTLPVLYAQTPVRIAAIQPAGLLQTLSLSVQHSVFLFKIELIIPR